MRVRGGLIGSNPSVSQSVASNIWHIRDAESYTRSGNWPALPGAPTSVSGTAGNAQVSLTWTAPATNGGYAITDYTVQYSSNSGSSWTTFSRAASSATSATVTGLTNGTAYTFRVAAVTALGAGAYSSASSSVTPISFSPTAVLLTSGTSYTVPAGATTMKAWAIGAGGGRAVNDSGGAGGCAYRTWSVSGGQSVSYAVGAISAVNNGTGGNTTVTFSGTTISGNGGSCSPAGFNGATGLYANGGPYSGGDGGANGGGAVYGGGATRMWGGAVGGNSNSATAPNRLRPTDVSGLFAAVALAGGTTTETGAATGAVGTGGFSGKFDGLKNAGLGGGGAVSPGGTAAAGGGAVVLYFT